MSNSDRGVAPAGLPRRLGAILYDSLLVAALLIAAAGLAFAVRGGEPPPVNASWYSAYLAMVPLGFFVGFWCRGGQTLGMRAWRIRLVAADGGAVRWQAAVLRFFAALLSWAAGGLGFLWQLVDRDRRSWHDVLSGTRIVHEPAR